MNSKEKEIADLRSRLEVLEHENQMLAERSEDMTLMSMITEISNESRDLKKMVADVLERISMLKDIMVCSCGTLNGQFLDPIATFWQLDDDVTNHQVRLDEQLVSTLNEGSVYLNGEEVQQVHFCRKISSMDPPVKEILLFTFVYKLETPAVFIFADNSKGEEKKLEKYIPLLQQVTYLVEDRINNIYLLDELQKIKVNLEKRVSERTSELEKINAELKSEIERRTQAEIETELSAEKFREIFNHANDALILWEIGENNFPVKCLEVNEVFLMMTGFSEEEVLKMSPDEIRGSEDEHLREGRLKDATRDKRRFEINLRTRAGNEVPTEANTRKFRLRDKNVLLAVHRDITERKQFEARILEEKNRAEESDRLKSVFLANMSHEIRTPMNAIVGFSELLYQEDLTNEEKRTYLDILQAKSQDLLTLINDILFLSKIEAEQVQIRSEVTDLDEYLRMSEISWKQMLTRANNTEISMSFEYKNTDGKLVIMDEVRVSQVINNLISNAIKFTEQGGVTIGCEVRQEMIWFYVKDSGIGIQKQKMELIFERFRQADEGQARRFGGSGLGLSICKQLVNLMGGEIRVTSEVDKGSVFTFNIPLELAGEKQEKGQARNFFKQGRLTKGAEILIVEDEITNFEFLQAALKIHDLEIHHASTAEEAIRLFENNPGIKLVLMDLHLPGMSGIEATRIIKEQDADVPVIAQTAVSPEEVKVLENNELLDDYIYKPINTELLFSKMSKFLNS